MEAKWQGFMNELWTVFVPVEETLRRIKERDGLDEEQVRKWNKKRLNWFYENAVIFGRKSAKNTYLPTFFLSYNFSILVDETAHIISAFHYYFLIFQAQNRIQSQLTNKDRIDESHVVFCSLWDYSITRAQVTKAIKLLRQRTDSIHQNNGNRHSHHV